MNSVLVNPYDFANPVNNMLLFADRIKERKEIQYYLDHATAAPQPISIALMGPRAAGKTSLLNFAAQEAKSRGFLTVRINLDEDNVSSVFSFFYKVFDSVFTEAVSEGCYEGLSGQVYDAYLDVTSAGKLDVEKVWMPFVFPLVYARAVNSQMPGAAQFPDNLFAKDLSKLQTEVGRPVVLIFDECDLLSNARSILQKLRNTFMNLQGFMLVFAGTPQLFPVMDEVFSPIVRQFKKIQVREFGDQKDTEECIRKPLELAKGDLPAEVFSLPDRFIREVHELSSGRPYEVQLLCHAMFKRIQSGRAKTMGLDVAVLEDVQRELAQEQNIASRRILANIKQLDDEQLRCLAPFCRSEGKWSLDQIWQVEWLSRKRNPPTRERLEAALEDFIELGVLERDESGVAFCGDYFDRVFAKYFAREKRVSLMFSSVDPEIAVSSAIIAQLTHSERFQVLSVTVGGGDGEALLEQLKTFAEKLRDTTQDAFVGDVRGVEAVYMLMMRLRHLPEIPIYTVTVRLKWMALTLNFGPSTEGDAIATSLEQEVSDLRERVAALGGEVLVSSGLAGALAPELLQERIKASANKTFREEVGKRHLRAMYDAYLEDKNRAEAEFHVQSLGRLDYAPQEAEANNIGYISLSLRQLDSARKFLEIAVNSSKEQSTKALAMYNLGITALIEEKYEVAADRFGACLTVCESLPRRDRIMSCLFVPRLDEAQLVQMDEIFDSPDLGVSAGVAMDVVRSLSERAAT